MRLNRRGYAEEEGTIPDPPGPPLPPGMKEPLLPGEIPPGFFDWRNHDPFYYPPGGWNPDDGDSPFGPDYPAKPPDYNPGPPIYPPWWDPFIPDLTPSSPDTFPPWLDPYIPDLPDVPDWFPDLPDWINPFGSSQ